MSLVKPQTLFNSKLTSRPSSQILVCGKTGKEHNSLSRTMIPLWGIWSLEFLYFDFPMYKMKRLIVNLKKKWVFVPHRPLRQEENNNKEKNPWPATRHQTLCVHFQIPQQTRRWLSCSFQEKI